MILTLLKFFVIAFGVALAFGFIILMGAMLAAVLVRMAEESEYSTNKVPKEELTDGDNEA